MSIEQILAAFLNKLLKKCVSNNGQQQLQLVISVPIYFGVSEIEAIKIATKIANIEYPIEFVKESEAISLFYAF